MKNYKILTLIAVLFLSFGMFGQNVPPPVPPPPPPGLPIDGGVILLSIIAAVYGVFKLKK